MNARFRLTERDLKVLEWIGCCGGDELRHISARYWPLCKPHTADVRLMKLVTEGYLSVTRDRRDVTRTFFLTEKAAKSLPGVSRLHLQIGVGPDVTRAQSRMLPMAISTIEANARAQGGELIYWRTEREVRAALLRRKVDNEELSMADGQAVIRGADGRFHELNVEIDGEYYGKMLTEKLEKLTEHRQATLWCCTRARAAYLRKRLAGCAYAELLVLEGGRDDH